MADQPTADIKLPDPAELSKNFVKIAAQSQQLLAEFMQRNELPEQGGPGPDPVNLGSAFAEFYNRLFSDPTHLFEAQIELWQSYITLWNNAAQRFLGGDVKPAITPEPSDRRFRDKAWSDGQLFDFIKQSYLVTANWLQKMTHRVDGMDRKTAEKVRFYTRQFVDAMAPSNFVLTNPEVLRATLESNGENLVKGLQNLLEDLERGKGKLQIKMTDLDAFEVGRNIAITPGKVVFQNDLMQLIQYEPRTEQVYKTPLMIVPPWINKYYILDLKPENSLVKWALEQGHTVFIVSWVNPDERHIDKTFESYSFEGIQEGLEAVRKATGEHHVNVLGFCIGGTLLASTLAYMTATGDDRVNTATFLAAQVDFIDAGELQVFVDEEQIRQLEEQMNKKGYLEASEMAQTFSMLRENDLIWSFVVNNYLLGKEPFPFDLLYWNADATRMPAKMHSYYLRNMYQRNLLVRPGALKFRDVPLDLRQVKVPVYLQSGREDHIAPPKSVYKATQIYKGPVRFIMAGSGHVAGVVNPPAAKKYSHYTSETGSHPPALEDWVKGAKENPGSWWPDWAAWLARQSGPMVKARKPGDGQLKPIEDAPGSYVKVKSE
jgi:polyhydroxyalkanoate synthase